MSLYVWARGLTCTSTKHTWSDGLKTRFFWNSFYRHGLSMNPFKPTTSTFGFCVLSLSIWGSHSLYLPGCCVRDVCRPVRKGTNLFVRVAELIFRNRRCSGRLPSQPAISVQPGCWWILSLSCGAFPIMVMIDLGHHVNFVCANWLLIRSQSQNRWWDVSPSHIK